MVMYGDLIIQIVVTLFVSVFGFQVYLMLSRRTQVEHAVREETGERHKAKSRIPDMAGIVMLITYAVLVPVFTRGEVWSTQWSLLMYYSPLAFGLLGLSDDLAKNLFRNTKGIPARYRIFLQLIIAVGSLFLCGTVNPQGNPIAVVFLVIFILATVNAANFTDGLDGLLAGNALIPALGIFQIMKLDAFSAGVCLLSDWNFPHIGVFIPILIVFLMFNSHPAKMFMGDSGSMFIGAFLAAYAVTAHMIIPFLIMGLVIYLELLSVVIQVVSFKLTGKRVFPMTPLHHSFEKWGWKEQNIVWLFYGVTLFLTVVVVSLAPHFEFYIYWG